MNFVTKKTKKMRKFEIEEENKEEEKDFITDEDAPQFCPVIGNKLI